jgi:hypothetical protein
MTCGKILAPSYTLDPMRPNETAGASQEKSEAALFPFHLQKNETSVWKLQRELSESTIILVCKYWTWSFSRNGLETPGHAFQRAYSPSTRSGSALERLPSVLGKAGRHSPSASDYAQ